MSKESYRKRAAVQRRMRALRRQLRRLRLEKEIHEANLRLGAAGAWIAPGAVAGPR